LNWITALHEITTGQVVAVDGHEPSAAPICVERRAVGRSTHGLCIVAVRHESHAGWHMGSLPPRFSGQGWPRSARSAQTFSTALTWGGQTRGNEIRSTREAIAISGGQSEGPKAQCTRASVVESDRYPW
jgi:hypothetical protein